MAKIIIQSSEDKLNGIHYEVDTNQQPLGVGGMGQVFKGTRIDSRTGVARDVAIKFLFDDLSAGAIERAQREASIRISNENLIEMFGFITVEEPVGNGGVCKRYHVVSELLNGVMLQDLLEGNIVDKQGQEVPYASQLYELAQNDRTKFALDISINVLSGIMALHDKGYIHRDIDPSNIFVTSDGKIKIIDFGIAKQINTLGTQDRQLTTAGQFMGKAAYAAPELVVGDVVHQNATTDIYAIGIMLFQLLTGRTPFEGATHEVLDMQLHKSIPLKDIQNKELRKIIQKATAKKQSDRYQSAAEFRVALENIARNPDQKPKLNFALIGSAAAAVVAVIIGVSIMAGGDSSDEQAENATPIEEIAAIEPATPAKPYSINDPVTKDNAQEAVEKIMSDETIGFDQANNALQQVIALGGPTASEAAWISGRLYAADDKALPGKSYSEPASPQKAFEMNSLALQLDSTNVRALFEMGQAYHAGESRTGGMVVRDLDKAAYFYNKCIDQARKNGDMEFINKATIRLEQIK